MTSTQRPQCIDVLIQEEPGRGRTTASCRIKERRLGLDELSMLWDNESMLNIAGEQPKELWYGREGRRESRTTDEGLPKQEKVEEHQFTQVLDMSRSGRKRKYSHNEYASCIFKSELGNAYARWSRLEMVGDYRFPFAGTY